VKQRYDRHREKGHHLYPKIGCSTVTAMISLYPEAPAAHDVDGRVD